MVHPACHRLQQSSELSCRPLGILSVSPVAVVVLTATAGCARVQFLVCVLLLRSKHLRGRSYTTAVMHTTSTTLHRHTQQCRHNPKFLALPFFYLIRVFF